MPCNALAPLHYIQDQEGDGACIYLRSRQLGFGGEEGRGHSQSKGLRTRL